ncbi:hypothetical protein EDD29_3455 [Actinocorallia herbida]|uniref:Neocarzinostatin family protein n=1 Tax=Actinocorallia herbida TaxID=58109 RepID=A0A3N1CX99_9ACTN|nr:hypothetical protein [Actinocorallia herbida]ROO85901.1 hypothetical protein EDD29_3455 [Actinocorallia herbida]
MLRKIAISAAGAGAIALLVSNPAMAVGTFPPSAPYGITSWTATGASAVTASSTNISFQDVTAGITANCTSGSASGTLNASGGPTDPVVSGLSISTSGCASTSPALSFTLTPNTPGGAWELYATGPTSGGVTPGQIRGVSVKGTALGGLCVVQVDGPGGANSQTGVINGSYSAGVITASGSSNITIASASIGCFGAIKKGDVATLSGTFNVTSSPVPTISAV